MSRRHRLPRAARLLSGAQFRAVFAARQCRQNQLFRVFYRPAEQARLGMVVSRRVSSRAVVRNRIRRQIRETFRLRRARLKPMDYVVVARPAARRAERHVLKSELERLWQRFSDDS